MATTESIAQPAQPSTRESRGLALFEEYGELLISAQTSKPQILAAGYIRG